MTMRVALLGAGRLARATGALLARSDVDLAIWARDERAAHVVVERGHGHGRVVRTVAEACADASLVFVAVPIHAFVDVADQWAPVARGDQIALHAARGVGPGFALGHALLRSRTCIKKIGVLGGPLYVEDAALGRTVSAVVASRFDEVIEQTRRLARGSVLRVHASHDLAGVEVAGAISNVAQIAVGLAEGCGLGETDQGIILVRALHEATLLGVHLGADRATYQGLAGVGDLIPRHVTSTKMHRDLGVNLAVAQDDVEIPTQLEGPRTAHEASLLAQRHGFELPLVMAVDDVLARRAAPRTALERVLSLDLALGT